MTDVQIHPLGDEAAPADWLLPPGLEIVPKVCRAVFDGTSAAGAFLPTLTIISDSGREVASVPTTTSVAAGASAKVSWFPGGELDTGGSAATLTGAWAAGIRLSSDAPQSIPSKFSTEVTFAHFLTSDATVLTSYPNNAAGDYGIRLLKPGVVTFRLVGGWESFNAEKILRFTSSSLGNPATGPPLGAFTTPIDPADGGFNINSDVVVYTPDPTELQDPFVAYMEVSAWNNDVVARNLTAFWMTAHYTPAANSYSRVY